MFEYRSEFEQLKDFQNSLTPREKELLNTWKLGLAGIARTRFISSREAINISLISFIEGYRFKQKEIDNGFSFPKTETKELDLPF